jgi:hypothetical protein
LLSELGVQIEGSFRCLCGPDAAALKARLQVGEDWPERWETFSHGERKGAQIAVALWREPAGIDRKGHVADLNTTDSALS